MFTYYLGIGSNQGDRLAYLRETYAAFAKNNRVLGIVSASIYETDPMYFEEQPRFLNTVFRCVSLDSLFPFFYFCKHIETQLGRIRTIPNGPRTIDIDILFADQAIIRTAELVVPHPRCTERRFVLEPLLEINDKLVHPVEQSPLSVYLEYLRGTTITKTEYTITS